MKDQVHGGAIAEGCEREWEWNGYEITPSANGAGWVYEQWSCIQGCRTGMRIYIPFGGDFPVDVDWDADWNECMDYAAAFADLARETLEPHPWEPRRHGIQILSRGRVVQ